jgi:hypothetical protein
MSPYSKPELTYLQAERRVGRLAIVGPRWHAPRHPRSAPGRSTGTAASSRSPAAGKVGAVSGASADGAHNCPP